MYTHTQIENLKSKTTFILVNACTDFDKKK